MTNMPGGTPDRTHFVSEDALTNHVASLSLHDSKVVDSHVYCQPKLHYQGNPTKYYVVNVGKSTGIWDDW
jgi:hypothetical protein